MRKLLYTSKFNIFFLFHPNVLASSLIMHLQDEMYYIISEDSLKLFRIENLDFIEQQMSKLSYICIATKILTCLATRVYEPVYFRKIL